jgi:hypothetical protein
MTKGLLNATPKMALLGPWDFFRSLWDIHTPAGVDNPTKMGAFLSQFFFSKKESAPKG